MRASAYRALGSPTLLAAVVVCFGLVLVVSPPRVAAEDFFSFAPLLRDNVTEAFGAVLRVSDDSRLLAVGDPLFDHGNGAIFLYERTCPDDAGDPLAWPRDCEWQHVSALYGSSTERFGQSFEMSPDGTALAVQRYINDTTAVHVFTTAVPHLQLGQSIQVCPQQGQQQPHMHRRQRQRPSTGDLSIGQAYDLRQQATTYHVVSSCTVHDDGRGSVRCHSFSRTTGTWEPVGAQLLGKHTGAYFGAQVEFLEAPSPTTSSNGGRTARVAVSAPGLLNSTHHGVITVYELHNMQWLQLGRALRDDVVHEPFQNSFAISATNDPYLAVSSSASDEAGVHPALHIFHWTQPSIHEPNQWVLSSVLDVDDDQLELANCRLDSVAISRQGDRVTAVTACDGHRHRQIIVFERLDTRSWMQGPEIQQFYNASLTGSVAVNPSGSIVIAGVAPPDQGTTALRAAQVSSRLDVSAFCGLPGLHPGKTTLETYLDRRLCRHHGITLITTQHDCSQAEVFHNGAFVLCVWFENETTVVQEEATQSPSTVDTEMNVTTILPSSAMPAENSSETGNTDDSPMTVPSSTPTQQPSSSQSIRSTVTPSLQPPGSSNEYSDDLRLPSDVPTLSEPPTVQPTVSGHPALRSGQPTQIDTVIEANDGSPIEEGVNAQYMFLILIGLLVLLLIVISIVTSGIRRPHEDE